MKRSRAVKHRTERQRNAYLRRMKKAWQNGYDARYTGMSLDDNPHMHWLSDRSEWEAGYIHADEEIRDRD